MRLTILVFAVFTLSSCAQLTRLDTARTIGEGNSEIGAHITAFGVDETSSPDFGGVAIPFVVLNFNHGISEKVDLMFSANTAANIYFSPKIQVYGDQNSSLAISVLPGVDMQLGNLDAQDEPDLYFRPHISSIISLHQNKWALFLEPKYIYQYWTENHFFGSTIGVDYSMEKTSIALGYSYFPITGTDLAAGSNLFQIGVGVRRLLGKKIKD